MFSSRAACVAYKSETTRYDSDQAPEAILMRKLSSVETTLIPIMLVALLVISSLAISGHIETTPFAITSMGIIGVGGVITLTNKEERIDKLFEIARLAIAMTVLSLTVKGIISVRVAAPILVATTGFSFCCLLNSTLPLMKYISQRDDKKRDKGIIDKLRKRHPKIERNGQEWSLVPVGEKRNADMYDYRTTYYTQHLSDGSCVSFEYRILRTTLPGQ